MIAVLFEGYSKQWSTQEYLKNVAEVIWVYRVFAQAMV